MVGEFEELERLFLDLLVKNEQQRSALEDGLSQVRAFIREVEGTKAIWEKVQTKVLAKKKEKC